MKIFIMVKLLLKKPMNIKQTYQMRLMILLGKQNQKIKRKNEKKNVKKNLYYFIQVEKWFLMPLKVKYF